MLQLLNIQHYKYNFYNKIQTVEGILNKYKIFYKSVP